MDSKHAAIVCFQVTRTSRGVFAMSTFDPQRASTCSRLAIRRSRRSSGAKKGPLLTLKVDGLELSIEVRKSTALTPAFC